MSLSRNTWVEPIESRLLLSGYPLDNAFADHGKLVAAMAGDHFVYATQLLTDGKMLLAGWTNENGDSDMMVMRLMADGSPDASFGVGGKSVIDLGSGADAAYAMALQADGKIVLAGQVDQGSYDMAIVRLNADGSLDGTFGVGGVATVDFDGSFDQANAVAVTSAGIVAAGQTMVNGDWAPAVVRVSSAGVLDPAFGVGGKNVFSMSGFTVSLSSMAALADGHLLLGVTPMDTNSYASDFGVIRLNSDGSLDHKFGNGGRKFVDMGGDDDSVRNITPGAGGEIFAAGASSGKFAVLKLMADGSVDASYGSAGKALVGFDAGNGENAGASTMSLLGDGSAFVGGWATVNDQNDFAVVLLTPAGQLDATFGSGGKMSVDMGNSIESILGSAVSSSAAVFIGFTFGDDADAAVIRFALTAPNISPVADAGGPYTTSSGGTVNLSAAGSSDADGTVASYEWDFNYTGGAFHVDATGASPMFSASGLAGPLTRTIAVRVTDDKGAQSVATAVITITNIAPVAGAGGPYSVNAGESVGLSGAASSDADGTIVKYEWDFNYSGTFHVDSTGSSAIFSAAGLAGPATRTVALRITDNAGAQSLATATVNIVPVVVSDNGPTVNMAGDTTAVRGQPRTFVATASGASGLQVAWSFGDGSSIGFKSLATGANPTHAFVAEGTYNVVATVRDLAGHTATASKTVVVSAYMLRTVGNKTDLVVGGTDDDDVILFSTRPRKQQGLLLYLNGRLFGPFNVTGHVVAYGQGGDDLIALVGLSNTPAEFYGGDGNDLLKGSLGRDTLIGGAGDDWILTGFSCNDVVDPGTGRDRVRRWSHWKPFVVNGIPGHHW